MEQLLSRLRLCFLRSERHFCLRNYVEISLATTIRQHDPPAIEGTNNPNPVHDNFTNFDVVPAMIGESTEFIRLCIRLFQLVCLFLLAAGS